MKKKTKENLVVGYIRVSTKTQDLSPSAQRRILRSWCKASGCTLVAVCEDLSTSGTTNPFERRGFKKALGALKTHNARILLVPRRDRLARNVVVTTLLEEVLGRMGVTTTSADGIGNGNSPAERFIKTIVDGLSQYEHEIISQRTREALAVKKLRKERVGHTPFGFRVGANGKRLIADAGEKYTISKIFRLRESGMSLQEIASYLTEKGFRSRGVCWYATSVRRILTRGW